MCTVTRLARYTTSLASILLLLSQIAGAQGNTLWRLGLINDSSAEFKDYAQANPELLQIPADWSFRTDWQVLSKGLSAFNNPAMILNYSLDSIPTNGALFSFKILDANILVPS